MNYLALRKPRSLQRLAVLAISAALLLPASANAEQTDSLPSFISANSDHQPPTMNEEQANKRAQSFTPTAWHDGSQVYVGFTIPEQTYMYQDNFEVKGDGIGRLRIEDGTSHSDEFFGDVAVYRESIVMAATLAPALTGTEDPIKITVSYQGCADYGMCFPPEEVSMVAINRSLPPSDFYLGMIDIPSDTDSGWAPGSAQADNGSMSGTDSQFSSLLVDASLLKVTLLFFLAGLALTFTPCVLPMLPIMSAIVVGQKATRRRGAVLSASYVMGMAATYSLVGVLMGVFGATLNIQAKLQSPIVLSVFAAVFFVLALAMMGVLNITLPAAVASRVGGLQNKVQGLGPTGSALSGALSVLVVSPCVSAPLAGALVYISSTGNAVTGGLALLAMGLGMGVPLMLVGTFGTSLLPKSGAWMNGVKVVFGFMMLAIAIWLLGRFVGDAISLLLWAGFCITTAFTLGVLPGSSTNRWALMRQGMAIFPLVWAIALIMGAASGGDNPLQPLSHVGNNKIATQASDTLTVTSLAQLRQVVRDGKAEGRPVFAHVTADWCSSCKTMERRYAEPAVAAAMQSFKRVAVDITENSADSKELLAHCKAFGPPTLMFFNEGKRLDDGTLQGEISSEDLIEHLNKMRQA